MPPSPMRPHRSQTVYRPTRRRLPDERSAFTHKFNVAGHEGYLTVGLYEDGQPGELFIRISKEGSTVAGMMEAFAIAVSVALQYGVPLKDLVNKFSHMRFEPAGFTSNPDVPMAKSIVDYIFRYLASKFLSRDEQDVVGVINRQMSLAEATPVVTGEAAVDTSTSSGLRDLGGGGVHCRPTRLPMQLRDGEIRGVTSPARPAPQGRRSRSGRKRQSTNPMGCSTV